MRDFFIRSGVVPLYEAQRRLRPATRDAIRVRDAALRFRRQAIGWPEERREEWVLRRLREVLRRAAGTPFYAARFRDAGFDPRADFGFDDFAGLPALEREEIREAGDALRDRAVPPKLTREDATGGSTGSPTEVWKGPEERGWGESAQAFFMARIGAPPGVRRALLWGHHLDPVASDRWRDRVRTLVKNSRWYDCFRITPERLAAYHRELQEWRPACVIAYAGALGALARAVDEQGLEAPRYPGICFVTGAEKLLPGDRAIIEAVYGRPVHERYGSRDVGLMGFQLDPGRGGDFEVDWANVLVEPETEGGETALLVTKLHGDAMPLVRYRIGDVATLPDDARPGHPAWRIREVLGRELDRLWLPDGSWFHAAGLPHLMKDHPVIEFTVEQAADLSITVRLVPARGYTAGTAERITEVVRSNVPGVPVEVVESRSGLERTPSGKRRVVVSHAAPPTGGR